MNRKTNKAGLDLIKYYEGLKLKAYKDIKGIWTIGYGHTGHDVVEGQEITEPMAQMLLQHDIGIAEATVSKYVAPMISDNQFGALVSLCYNIGSGSFLSSTLLKELNQGHFDTAASQFLAWDKAKINGQPVENQGLLARRRAERDLFLKDDDEKA